MKQLFLFLSLTVSIALSAQQGVIDQANDFYTQEKYEEAIQMYDSVLNTGVTSAELYYNLGNTHYKLGHIAQCILFYERALQLSPNDKDIAYNLELVQQHVVDEIEMVDEFFLSKMMRNVRVSLASDVWAKWSMTSFVIALVLLLVFFLTRSTVFKRIAFYMAILAFLASLLSFSFSSKNKKDITSHDSAIVLAPTVTVNSSPNESGTQIFVLHEGTKVSISDRLGDWVEIMLSDGNKGWMKAETIEEI